MVVGQFQGRDSNVFWRRYEEAGLNFSPEEQVFVMGNSGMMNTFVHLWTGLGVLNGTY